MGVGTPEDLVEAVSHGIDCLTVCCRPETGERARLLRLEEK